MPDDHSEVVPLLPIPNRTVKRLCADDSADSRVKVGHCQALTAAKGPAEMLGLLFFEAPGLRVENVLTIAQRRAGTNQVGGELFDPGVQGDVGKPALMDHLEIGRG